MEEMKQKEKEIQKATIPHNHLSPRQTRENRRKKKKSYSSCL